VIGGAQVEVFRNDEISVEDCLAMALWLIWRAAAVV